MTFDLRDVDFSYRTRNGSSGKVIDHLDLSIKSGECVGVMGHEGAGKTTLLQLMIGLLKPDRGSVHVNGKNIQEERQYPSEVRRRVGFAFQFPEQQFFCETVEDELMYALKNFGSSESFQPMKPDDALNALGLRPDRFMQRSPFSLSMGEGRRVALATLLMTRPNALLLDEPTVGLDGAGVEIVLDLLRRAKDEGKTTVIVSHDIDVLAEATSRIIILENGSICEDGSTGELFTNEELLSQYGYQLPEVVRLMKEVGRTGKGPLSKSYTIKEAKIWFDSLKGIDR